MTKCPCSSDWSRSKQFQLYFFQIKNISSEREIEFQVSKVKESRVGWIIKLSFEEKILSKRFHSLKNFWSMELISDLSVFLSTDFCQKNVFDQSFSNIGGHFGDNCIFMFCSIILTIRTFSHLSVVCINIFKSNQSGKKNCAVSWMTVFKA